MLERTWIANEKRQHYHALCARQKDIMLLMTGHLVANDSTKVCNWRMQCDDKYKQHNTLYV